MPYDHATQDEKHGPSEGLTLSGLYVYPIKSAAGVAVERAEVEERGLRHDRRWMLVDGDGVFFSQRRFPRMALIRVGIEQDHLSVEAPDMPPLEVPLMPENNGRVQAEVWGDVVDAVPAGQDADRWFGEFFGGRYGLVHLPDDSVRPVDPDYGSEGDHVSLADGFPFLTISEASLADLNARLEEPLPMNRFRPNLVVRGCAPFAEDHWKTVRIGGIPFRAVKRCARCAITTVDQDNAETGKEPLRTLATFRKVGSKVLFGQNLVGDSTGTLSVGDAVETGE